MVVLRGPVLSFEASGSIAKLLCYGRNHGQRSVRMIPRPSPARATPSVPQTRQRDRYRRGVDHWNRFDDPDQAAWTRAANHSLRPMTGYNLWLSWWLTLDAPWIRTLQQYPDVGTLPGGPDDPLPQPAGLYPRWLAFGRPSVANPSP